MGGEGNKILHKGIPVLGDAFVIIVKTEWNDIITGKLEEGAIRILKENNIQYHTIIVPGAIEIPFAIRAYTLSRQKQPDAFIAFGAVIRGGTPHFEYVCKSVTEGISTLNLTLEIPTIFGVLTLENEAQAIERTGGPEGHKGEEAAYTALKMIHLKRQLAQADFLTL
ncbi:MAG: 6,7-dimethyl-8-ribityllumazine synthase [Bacteroidetes bacterium]|nr:6,7-dimethyl-8-ribityllumazine synthase [Bacteroidota bacterium]